MSAPVDFNLLDPTLWFSLFTLTVLEIVLGIDNVIFLSIVSSRLPGPQQAPARNWGLGFALVTRLLFLGSVIWLTALAKPFAVIGGFEVSVRDIVLAFGGLFLLVKATQEIYQSVEGEEGAHAIKPKNQFAMVIFQIILLDIVFSFDSIFTAVGLTNQFAVMAIAIAISIVVMMAASAGVSRFVQAHPSVKMLALSFLLLIGMSLTADALHFHIPREYLYFAVSFSIFVETLNIVSAKRRLKRSPIAPQ
ncbi:MAG: TerC family protein [Vampirovibrionales bacterium]|nr:TerC family protein [Vampirovibrionales bacterium]